MKVAIIGAGPSGLVALKYGLDYGHECDLFEQAGKPGGVWIYREEIADEDGNPNMSPMYRDLKTNTPKELMLLCDLPYDKNCNSYNHHSGVLEYINKFVNHFHLEEYIKCWTCVTKVEPIENERWRVTTQNVKTCQEQHNEYDAVFICTGYQATSAIPKFPGQDTFQGTQFHSCYFRKPEDYTNKRVLLLGAGPSASDIAGLILQVTPHVYLSYEKTVTVPLPKGLYVKPSISHFTETTVVFTDGSEEVIDVVIYGIGYQYYYPFLAEECGIKVEDHCVRPLYNHIVNVEHSSMFFINVAYDTPIFVTMDLEVRYAYAALQQDFALPPKDIMMKEVEDYISKKKILTRNVHNFRLAGENVSEHFEKLAVTSGVEPMPPVLYKIYDCIRKGTERFPLFKIIDNDNFICTGIDKF